MHEPLCPGFGWGRVNFLPGSWGNAVFWIWDDNSVDNILMLLAVARQSRIWLPWHVTSCPVYELGQLGGGQRLLDVVHWVVSNCIVHHLFCVYSIVTIIITIISSFAFLLNCLYLNPWIFTFSPSPPHPMGSWGRECWAAIWCLVAGWG